MAKKSERKNRSARERMRAEEKELDEKYAAMEVERQKWLDTIGVLQIVFVAVISVAMWLVGKYCDATNWLRGILTVVVVLYALGTVPIKWRAIDTWDADLNQIANGRFFASMTLLSGFVAFLT